VVFLNRMWYIGMLRLRKVAGYFIDKGSG